MIKFGKGDWVQQRDGFVDAKGKGELKCFWVVVKGDRAGSVGSCASQPQTQIASGISKAFQGHFVGLDKRTCRLIDWNVEMLLMILQEIGARRTNSTTNRRHQQPTSRISMANGNEFVCDDSIPLEEVCEIIFLPEFENSNKKKDGLDPKQYQVPLNVTEQLHDLVANIARMYNDNPFHNFGKCLQNVDGCTFLVGLFFSVIS